MLEPEGILGVMDQNRVIDYYDYTIPFYKMFWHKGTNALHYGLWDANTRTLSEALINSNKVLSEIADIKESDSVLDAGCGVGGSALWLAKNKGSKVTGITISEKQKNKAVTYAMRQEVEEKVEFFVRDFLNTGFPDTTFTVVWAIESVCHATRKINFLREAFRILKPGGRIIIADGFLGRELKDGEQEMYEDFLRGFALYNLAHVETFESDLKQAGFTNVQVWDKTKEIQKTSEQMYHLSKSWMWLNKLLVSLRLIPELMVDNMRTGIVQKEFFAGPGRYAIFYAEKS
jgi:cyclopropane fatty-acyl-phospholipid synthase-like methyltransferase